MAAADAPIGPRGWLTSIVAAAAALVGFALLAPLVPIDQQPLALSAAGILAFVCVCIEVLAVAAMTPPATPRWLIALPLPLAILGAVGTSGDMMPPLGAAALVTAALLAAGTLIGSVVGSAIDEAGHLLVVAVISAIVDVFSVLHPSGPTNQLIQVEAAVSLLILPWPILGTGRIEPILGFGDIAFAAIYVAAARRHDLSIRRTLVALASALLVTLGVVLVTGVGIPALPFFGVAIVVAHPEARRVPAKDRNKALVGLGLLVAVFAALFALR